MKRPLIAIVGPTASGKTGLAITIAKKYNGEIIAADSRTIYRHLDLGTAKPTILEQQTVPHWGLDLVEPDERYSAAHFQRYAASTIDAIRGRGHVPLLVGGTGLYINGVVYDYSFIKVDERKRAHLEDCSIEELKEHCNNNNIQLPENGKNKRHLIAQILRDGVKTTNQLRLEKDTYVVGITTDSDQLRQRIHQRSLLMLESGVLEETSKVASQYGREAPGLTGNIYQVSRQLLAGDISQADALERIVTLDWQLAKRQMTWFKRDPNIKWLQLDEAEHYIAGLLTSEQ